MPTPTKRGQGSAERASFQLAQPQLEHAGDQDGLHHEQGQTLHAHEVVYLPAHSNHALSDTLLDHNQDGFHHTQPQRPRARGRGGTRGGSFFNISSNNAVHTEHHLARQTSYREMYQAGNFGLPFTMLRVVLDDLAEKLSTDEQLSEPEGKIIAEFASELQHLSSKTAMTKEKAAIANSNPNHNGQIESNAVENDPKSGDFEVPAELTSWQQELVEIFKKLDIDSSGSLSADELRRGLMEAKVPMARLTKLLRSADSDRSGEIELKEWVRALTESSDRVAADMHELSGRLSQRFQQGTLFASENRRRQFILHPTSWRRIWWDFVIVFVCVYLGAASPFVVAWSDELPSSTVHAFDVVDMLIIVVLALDIVLNFCTAYISEDDELILDPGLIAKHYIQGWFILDLLSTFPFEYFGVAAGEHMQVLKILKLGKLLKLVKMMAPRHIDFSELSDYLDHLSTSKTWQMVNRRSNILVNLLLVCHWMACGMKIVDEGFLMTYQDVEGSIGAQYLAALYWAMTTLTTVGYGDITPSTDVERVYTTMAMVVGGGFYGYVVGCICSMVSNSDLNSTAFYDRMELVHAWLVHHKLPLEMKRRLRRYFKVYLSEKSAVSEADIWRDLTPELQREVGEHIIHQEVTANPLFDGLSIGTTVRLQSILQKATIHPGRTLAEQGEAGTAMYIICSGSLETKQKTDDEEKVIKLGAGESFGEEIILGYVDSYEYTVTAVEKTKLEVIYEDDFLALFNNMPNIIERMRQNFLEMNPHWART